MLSRDDLNIELVKTIKSLNPNQEISAELTTVEYFEILILIFSEQTERFWAPEATEGDKLELLRGYLREKLEQENFASDHRYLDKIFALQIILARAFPVSKQDPITQEDIDLNSPIVFFSNGDMVLHSSAQDFYSTKICYNTDNKYVDIINRVPLSERELISLQRQGVSNFIRIPSPLEQSAKNFGSTLGLIIGVTLFIGLIAFSPAMMSFPALAVGLLTVSMYTRTAEESTFIGYLRAFGVGICVTLIFGSILSLFTAGILATIALITHTSFAATLAAADALITTILPIATTFTVCLNMALTSRLLNISFQDAALLWTFGPILACISATSAAFMYLGKAIHSTGVYLNLLSDTHLPPVPPEDIEVVPELQDANLNSSTAVVFAELQANAAVDQSNVTFPTAPSAPSKQPAPPGGAAVDVYQQSLAEQKDDLDDLREKQPAIRLAAS